MRSLTFSSPSWSSSRIFAARLTSLRSRDSLVHGNSRQVSSQFLSTALSAEPNGFFDIRETSFVSFFSISSGRRAALIFSRYSSVSDAVSSPSSLRITFSCSRRKYSRWFLLSFSCTFLCMSSSAASKSCSSYIIVISSWMRFSGSTASSIFCLSSGRTST